MTQARGQCTSTKLPWQRGDLVPGEVEFPVLGSSQSLQLPLIKEPEAGNLVPVLGQFDNLIVAQVEAGEVSQLDHPLVHPGQSYASHLKRHLQKGNGTEFSTCKCSRVCVKPLEG